jgi:hypothetical protein
VTAETAPGAAVANDQEVAANLSLVWHPGHYMNHEASHLVDARSVEYWASLPGHMRDQAFVFEFDQSHVLTRVEWKDRGDGMAVARLALEAQVSDTWQKLSTWDAAQTSEWQAHSMSMSMRSHRWRLTFVCNHGDQNHLVVQAVRFMVQLMPSSPAQHNIMYSQHLTQKLWNDKSFTDVEVSCHTTRYSVHRAILASASPVFAAMLESGMREAQHQEIAMVETDAQSVHDTLQYIYTGTVSAEVGFGMVVLGHQYDIPGLVEYAAPIALGNLTEENVVSEVRILRVHATDAQLGPVFEALQSKVQEDPQLFRALMTGV